MDEMDEGDERNWTTVRIMRWVVPRAKSRAAIAQVTLGSWVTAAVRAALEGSSIEMGRHWPAVVGAGPAPSPASQEGPWQAAAPDLDLELTSEPGEVVEGVEGVPGEENGYAVANGYGVLTTFTVPDERESPLEVPLSPEGAKLAAPDVPVEPELTALPELTATRPAPAPPPRVGGHGRGGRRPNHRKGPQPETVLKMRRIIELDLASPGRSGKDVAATLGYDQAFVSRTRTAYRDGSFTLPKEIQIEDE